VKDGVTATATVSDNSITDVGDGVTFSDSLSSDDFAIRFILGNTSSAYSNVSITATGNTLTANHARGLVIDAYGDSTVGPTANDNSFATHLGNDGLDVVTAFSASVCLAASVFSLSTNNSDMTLGSTGGVAFNSACTP
jgi:hypothetical protein